MTAIAVVHKTEILERLKAHALKAERYEATLKRLRPVPSPNGGYRMTLVDVDRDGKQINPGRD